jgi:hypothetical protein
MAWSIGSNVAPGDVLTASRYNQDVIDNLTELAPFMSAWTDYTPQLRQGTTNVTSTKTYGRFIKVGKFVHIIARVVCTGTGPGNQAIKLGLPSTAFNPDVTNTSTTIVGTGIILDSGTAFYIGAAIPNESGYVSLTANGSVDYIGSNSPAMTLANNDSVAINLSYYVA